MPTPEQNLLACAAGRGRRAKPLPIALARLPVDQLLGGQRALGSAQDLHHTQAKTHVAGVGRTGLVDLVDERVERGAVRFDDLRSLQCLGWRGQSPGLAIYVDRVADGRRGTVVLNDAVLDAPSA